MLFKKMQLAENQGVVKSKKKVIFLHLVCSPFSQRSFPKKTGEGKVKAKSGEIFTLNLLIHRA